MSKRKTTANLYNQTVCGPTALQINDDFTRDELVRWWENTKLYAEAMQDLGRVTILVRDDDQGLYYLASVEEAPDAHA